MLDIGMSAKLFLRGEDTICMRHFVAFNFVLFKIGAVKVEPLKTLSEPVVEEGLIELHVSIQYALLQQFL